MSVAAMTATASKRSRMARQILLAGIPRLATRMGLPFIEAKMSEKEVIVEKSQKSPELLAFYGKSQKFSEN
jgi:hypothetical protein